MGAVYKIHNVGGGSRAAQRHKSLIRAHKIRRFRKVEVTVEMSPNWCCNLHRVGVHSGIHTGSEQLQLQFTSSSNFSLRSHFSNVYFKIKRIWVLEKNVTNVTTSPVFPHRVTVTRLIARICTVHANICVHCYTCKYINYLGEFSFWENIYLARAILSDLRTHLSTGVTKHKAGTFCSDQTANSWLNKYTH
jgi:hypothetical protein